MTKRLISAVPNTGRHNSCHINCCHMALQFRGENIALPEFIPLSTFTFGFLYVNDGKFVLPAISGCPCRDCMEFITEQLGYSYEIINGDSLDSVMPGLKECIDANQPVVAGPLPMELYREFNPQAPVTGLDSFCIITGYDDEAQKLFLTDTFGLGYMPVGFEKLASGWEAGKRLCPKDIIPNVPFLFVVKEKVRDYDELAVMENSLKRAYQLGKGKEISESISLGLVGQKKFLEDLKSGLGLGKEKLGLGLTMIREFIGLIGAQSRGDIVYFLHDYARKLSEKTRRAQVLKLADLYEKERFVFIEILKATSIALEDLEAGRKVEPHFSVVHDKVKRIVDLEEQSLALLGTTFSVR